MQYEDLLNLLEHTGKDPARLIFEDELTGISNRRFLRNYLEHKVSWGEADRPLSLLMLDLDGFKEINDTYGHEVGDEALIWVAEQLRDVAGAHGLPIRYAGDEFIILMPHSPRIEAVRIAEQLHERVSELTFHGPGGQELELRFSIGIATAPEDAQDGTGLIRRADAALYSAKARGGHCYVVADEINPQQLVEKTALYQLDGADITGRGPQLKRVAEALDRFALRESQFLVVTGGAGVGKSTFLGTIRRRLEKNSLGTVVSMQARPEELFRPYFLAADILVALMSQRPDKGLSLMEGLSPEQLAYASQILPQLGGDQELVSQPEQRLRREFIFNTLLLLIFRAVDFHPLIVLIDDLHFADEATLNLLRVLMSRAEVPLFVCATSTEAAQRADDLPLEVFLKAQQTDLGIEEIGLIPLSDAEILAHVRAMFPGMRIPEEFETRLCEIVQGNPLFLAEILRKLLMEQKIGLVGQEWTIQSMSWEELPRSLEEIVSAKIAVLDEEGRQLLAQASVIGENVQLSALAGTSEKMEARVFEFLDQAVRLGLLNSEFEVNDESIHFLSRRVLDIVYGKIQRPRRQELHERAGIFQEELFERKLMPSASVLAYHFGCSGNEEKSRNYVELKASRDDFVFNADEALRYSGDELPDCPTLDPESRVQVPGVLRWMLTAVNNVRLYPSESDAIISATRELQSLLASILSRIELLDIRRVDSGLLINGEEMELAESELVVEGALNVLRRLELRSVSFREGVGEEELGPLLVAFARTRPEEIGPHFWERFLTECGLAHVDLQQLRYTKTLGDPDQVLPQDAQHATLPAETVHRAAETTLDTEERADIRELIRCLLGAARGVRLYPIRSQALTAARDQLEEALTKMLNVHPILTLATAGDAVLVNGRRLGGADVDKLAGDLHEFMTSVQLAGLTFVAPVPESEISGFLAGLRSLPDLATDQLFWSHFVEEHGLSQIQVHESLYEVSAAGGPSGKEEVAAEPEPEAAPDTEELSPEDLSDFLEALPRRVEECIRSDDTQQLGGLVARLFGDFRTRDPGLRESTVVASRTALSKLDAGSQPILAKHLTAPMLDAFDVEDHPDVLRLMAAMLRRMSTVSIQFAEYSLACQLLSKLYPAPQSEQTSLRARVLSQVLKRELEPVTQDLILEDFNSPDSERQQGATRVLGALGPAAESLLVEVIRLTESRRVRQIAANLLSETGGNAGEALKRAIVFEEMGERRVRILEVLDSVTRDVTSELACALADKATEVRHAALRLAERIGDPEIAEIVLEHARGREAEPAAMAIRCLATLKPRGAMQEILEILHSARDAQRVIACCQALGQLGDPSAIQALTKILTPRSFFSLRRGWNSSVRTAAALALSQFETEEAGDVLARFAEDSDPAVRRIALNARGL